ncbi:uncharacterized protein ATC70_005974 [Mucor velutinosus]|uniref:Uncharacterized protein n=1 Tax=Mucor velutinosus TaxID=708070 RepID=A0AAN7HZS2_9FUNG|nr:hypothetical protein ATC70_005974 [Mucor velutinosus]
MNNSQQEGEGRERQRPDQYQHPAAAPENIFTNIYNVIAGARESASQEFTRFWESLGHVRGPYYSSPSAAANIQARKIRTPTSLRGRQFSRNISINGRFLPDDNVRGIVKDVEIQTDEDLFQPSSLSIPHKRSASPTFEEYHIPFPVKNTSKKTLFSLEKRDSSFERPSFLSRRIDTSNDDFSNQLQQEPSQQEKEEGKASIPQATSVSDNIHKEQSPPPPPPPPALPSLSPKRNPIRKAMSLSPNRPLSSCTSRAVSAGRFTTSPNRDIRTGSKSVRRLTMELEGQFSPKFPSPYLPKRQRLESIQDTSLSSSPQYDRPGESSSSPSSHYRSELAATIAAQAQAVSATMTAHTSPTKPLQPTSPKVHGADEQHPTTNKDEEDYYANLLKQRELDERVNKLEKKVSIARTRVSEFSAENGGGGSSNSSHITSPTPSHTILIPSRHHSIPIAPVSDGAYPCQVRPETPKCTAANAVANKKDMVLLESQSGDKSTSPLRPTTINPDGRSPFSYISNADPAIPSANPYKAANKSPVKDTRVSPSPYRSSIIVSSPQEPTKEPSSSPSSVSYAAAKAAIQEAVNRKSSASSFGEKISSVRSIVPRPFASASVPPAPPQPPQSASTSPSRASSYYPPKHTPSPYLQPSNGITQLKPNDQHKSKMKEVIKMIPHFNLRKADTIIGPDGVSRPNPIWLDIYDPKRRRLYDQSL